MLRLIKHIVTGILFFGLFYSAQAQILVQRHHIDIVYDSLTNQLRISQHSLLVNNAKQPIKRLILLNWANAYANKHTALAQIIFENYDLNFHFSTPMDRGEVQLDNLQINGVNNKVNLKQIQPDIYTLSLPEVLKPNDSLRLDFQYVIKLPKSKFTGYGMDRKGNILLRNFYFHPVPYLYQTYADKNIDDYPAFPTHFSIELKNFSRDKQVYSNLDIKNQYQLTGTVKNPEILITSEFYNTYKYADKKIILPDNKQLSEIDKTLIINKIFDFFKHKAGDYPENKILITHSYFKNHKVYGLDLLPKIINPYNRHFIWEFSVLHQLAKKYTDAILTDRRRNAWVQDGIANFWEYRYLKTYYPNMPLLGKLSKNKIMRFFYASRVQMSEKYPWLYLNVARLYKDQPLSMALDSLTNYNRNVTMPYKAALGLKILKDLQPDFEKRLKDFYALAVTQMVSGKDFCKNTVRDKDLKWFKTYVQSTRKYDYKLQKLKVKNDSVFLKIKNKNHHLLPLSLYGIKNDSVLLLKQLPAFENDTLIGIKNEHFQYVGFNYYNDYPEFQNNDNYKRPGFHLINKPVQIRPFQDFDNPLRTQVFVNPFFEYNYYDGLIAGAQIFNESFLFNSFKYNITPTYGFKSRSLTGSISLNNIYFFKSVPYYALHYGIGYKYYHYNHGLIYRKFNSHIELKFHNPYLRKRKGGYVALQYMKIDKDPVGYVQNETESYDVVNLRYKHYNVNVIKDFFYKADLQFSKLFGKASLMMRYRFLSDKNRQWDFRFFIGKFLYNQTRTDYFSFALDRPTDYLFQYHYYGRSESTGIFHQQFVWAEGGFKSFFDDQFANDYLISNNVNIGIWRWLNLYGDWAWLKRNNQPLRFYYDSGLRVNLVQDYFEIFFPIYSKLGYEILQPDYLSRIRIVFTMDINGLIKMIKRGWY